MAVSPVQWQGCGAPVSKPRGEVGYEHRIKRWSSNEQVRPAGRIRPALGAGFFIACRTETAGVPPGAESGFFDNRMRQGRGRVPSTSSFLALPVERRACRKRRAYPQGDDRRERQVLWLSY